MPIRSYGVVAAHNMIYLWWNDGRWMRRSGKDPGGTTSETNCRLKRRRLFRSFLIGKTFVEISEKYLKKHYNEIRLFFYQIIYR